MSLPAENLAVLFVDVCDSTRLYHELGDGAAHSLTARCLSCVSEATKQNGGHVVKTTGDGAMTTFPTVEQAYRTATTIQQSLCDGPLRVKIGFHTGPVLHAEGDVFGSTVNLAARLLARSGPGEILMTRLCADALAPMQRATVRLLDSTIVKGQPDPVEIYRVIGEREDETTIVPSSKKASADSALVLAYEGKIIRLKLSGPPVLIGRDARMQLLISSKSSSRHHATIEVQRNGYAITDHSSNGTYLVDGRGHEQFLRRESALLTGNGIISIGVPPSENVDGLIEYRHEGRAVPPAVDRRELQKH
jgi:class 3 adenylate cyclase